MLAAYVEPKLTPFTFEDLARVLSDGLATVLGRTPSDQVLSVALAKVRLESGNGRFAWNFNLGNVKCPPDVAGNFTCITLNEVEKKKGDTKPRVYWYQPNGELVAGRGSALRYEPVAIPDGHFQTRMRSLAGPTDAGYFYVDFVAKKTRYAKAMQALLAGNAELYARYLGEAGYYTAPIPVYTAQVVTLASESLAKLQKRPHETITPPEKWEWHNQLVLDQFVNTEAELLDERLNKAGSNLLAYERAEEEEKAKES